MIIINLYNYHFLCSMSFGYLVSIKCINLFMKNKSAYQLTYPMRLYNLLQILLNIYMVCGLYNLPFLPENPNIFGINAPYNNNIKYFLEFHYFSKYVDFIDTIIMAFRKKNRQISFLHVYHHISVCFIWGLLCNIGHNNGTAGFTALTNSIIHIIMYSHYLITSFGYNNPFKKIITSCQMVQFILFMIHSTSVIIWEINFPKTIGLFQLIYSFHMLSLFSDFYLQNYYKKQEMLE